MGRPPEENTARAGVVAFRIGSELELMELRRGTTGESRSRYLRRLIKEDAARKPPAPKRKGRDGLGTNPIGTDETHVFSPYFNDAHRLDYVVPMPAFTAKRGGMKFVTTGTEESTVDQDPYDVGTRWADKDSRSAGRVIEVTGIVDDDHLKRHAVVEAHPLNPTAVGRTVTVSIATLGSRYRKISR